MGERHADEAQLAAEAHDAGDMLRRVSDLARVLVGEVFVRLPDPTNVAEPLSAPPPRTTPGERRRSPCPTPEGVELGEAVEAFLPERDLALTSRRVYALTLAALIPDLGATTDVVIVGHSDLAKFLRRRHAGGAPKSWNRVLATLGSFFAYCERQGWVGASPAVGLERRRDRWLRWQAAVGRPSNAGRRGG